MTRARPEKAEANRLRDFALAVLARHGALAPDDEEAVRAALADMQTLRSGTELITEGAPQACPFLLLDGWAMRQRVLSDGRRQIFAFVLPGDPYSLCARRDAVATTSLVALTPVTVAPMLPLAEAMHEAPHSPMGQLAWNRLGQEEEALCNQIVRLGRQSAYERMIGLLLELHGRLAQVHLTDEKSFALPLTQEILADALGLSVVHTNRTLQQLRREHLVQSRGNTIALGDLAALAEIADYKPIIR